MESRITVFFERHHLNKRNKCKLCLGHGCRTCNYTEIEPAKKDDGVNTIWSSPGSAMKYFRWSHEQIMNMSWENYTMYIASIPLTPGKPDDKDDDAPTEEVDMFNLYG